VARRALQVPQVRASAAGPDEPDPYKSAVPAPDSLAGWSAFPVSAELVRQVSADESASRPYPAVEARSDAQPAVQPDSVSPVDAAVRPRRRFQEQQAERVPQAHPGASPAEASEYWESPPADAELLEPPQPEAARELTSPEASSASRL